MNFLLVDAWENLNFECQRLVLSNVENLGERVKAMENSRMAYDKLFNAWLLEELKKENQQS